MATMVKSNPWAALFGKKPASQVFPFSPVGIGDLSIKGNEGTTFRDLFQAIFLSKAGGAERIKLDPNVWNRVSESAGKEVLAGEGSDVSTHIPWDLSGHRKENKQASFSRGHTAFVPSIPSQEVGENRIGNLYPHDENDGLEHTVSPKNTKQAQNHSKKITASRFVSNPEKEIGTEEKAVFQRPVDGDAVPHPNREIPETETASSELLEGNGKPQPTTHVPSPSTRQKPEQKVGAGSGLKVSMKGVHHNVRKVSNGSMPASSPTIDGTDASEEIKTPRSFKKAVVKDGSKPVPSPHMNSETSEPTETLDPLFDAPERSVRQDSETADRVQSRLKKTVAPLHREGRVHAQDHTGGGVPETVISGASQEAEAAQVLPDGQKYESLKSGPSVHGVKHIHAQDRSHHVDIPTVVSETSGEIAVSQSQEDNSSESIKSNASAHRPGRVSTPSTAYDASIQTKSHEPVVDGSIESDSQSTGPSDARTIKVRDSATVVGADGKVLKDRPDRVVLSSVSPEPFENLKARPTRAHGSLKSTIQTLDTVDRDTVHNSEHKTGGSGMFARLGRTVRTHDHPADEVESSIHPEKTTTTEKDRASLNTFEKSVTPFPKNGVGLQSSRSRSVKIPVPEGTPIIQDTSEKASPHPIPENTRTVMTDKGIERMVVQDADNRRTTRKALSSEALKMGRASSSPTHDVKNPSIQTEGEGGQSMTDGMMSTETGILKNKSVLDFQKWNAEDGAPKVVFHHDRVPSSRPQGIPAGARDPGPPVNGLLASQIVPSMVRMVREGSSKVTVALRPKQLGRLRMVLVSEEGRLNAKLFVESSEVKELIDRVLPDMRAGLEKEGYRIQNFDVHVNREFPNLSDRGAGAFRDGRGSYASSGRYSQETLQEDARDENRHGDGVRYFGYNSMELVA